MLTTISRLKGLLKIPSSDTGEDSELEAVIMAASQAIENHCNRSFELKDRTELYDGSGLEHVFVRSFPVTTIDSIKIAGEVITDYLKIENSGMIYRKNKWPRGLYNIEISYSGGYVLPNDDPDSEVEGNLPKPVEQAALILARMIHMGEWGKESERFGNSYSVTYAKGDPGRLPPVVEALIGPYRRRMV
ncbi:phage gp6-like head-tail connector protein [Cohnella yongneupensis]|uniref:Phage gp6-like head-tail connector protein n=1 Tax=Cohnella yongneupensis TaxID=425006 RepID=A0ABW0QWH6_9BACL